ncbi:MAG TPA: OmpH family outer membrane protein [Saprospiraceae bacterium]|nr:OmpH family outer membrane protein [Saprospiraceae bacterium]
MKKLAVLFFLAFTGLQVGTAQQYGHLNFGNILAALPDTKAADADIQAYSKELIAQGEQKAAALQKEFAAVVQKIQNGELSPKQQEDAEAKFQRKQQELRAFEAEIQQKVAQKRQELLAPLIKKVEEAIAAVAKEKGIVMVFDTSVFNAILFAKDSDDLMPAVKVKLGL